MRADIEIHYYYYYYLIYLAILGKIVRHVVENN